MDVVFATLIGVFVLVVVVLGIGALIIAICNKWEDGDIWIISVLVSMATLYVLVVLGYIIGAVIMGIPL